MKRIERPALAARSLLRSVCALIAVALALSVTCWRPLSAQAANLFISSDFNHEVLRYDADTGAFQEVFIPVASNGGLNQPHGIIDRATDLIVASFGTDEVKQYNRDTGEYLGNFIPNSAGVSLPVYLANGPGDGLLYVSSQGNDRILRFNATTGVASDGSPFISGGVLDAPSGLGWSPDGSVLYVAGRNSANLIAYNAATGVFMSELATGLSGGNDTFGLAVEPGGDIFIAANGTVLRYSPAGALVDTIAVSAIGLELSPDGTEIFAATSNNLRAIDIATNTVASTFLGAGGTINVLNFFHFSSVQESNSAIPEPGTGALFAAAGLLVFLRRRKRSS